MKTYNLDHLFSNLSAPQLADLSDDEFILACWKTNGMAVLEAIDKQTIIPMTQDTFLTHCTACGGDWSTMLLSGVKALYPDVYNAIPDNLGMFAWRCICSIVALLNIKDGE
jgi:hypothetical protein